MSRRKNIKRSEQDIQKTIMRALDLGLPSDAIAFAVPNGGGRSHTEAAILNGQGVKAGVPDIIIIHRGTSFGLEVKSKTGTLSISQRSMFPRLRECGMRIEVVRSLDEALAHVRDFGIRIRIT